MSIKETPINPASTAQRIAYIIEQLHKYQVTRDMQSFINARNTMMQFKLVKGKSNKTEETKDSVSLEDLNIDLGAF